MSAKATPMMAQYQAVKAGNPDCLLFFRLGDFYELFGDDAAEASRLLGITLTARSSGEGRSQRIPMAGVPYHAAPGYIQKLLKAGRKVAVCEQMEDAKAAKGMLRRELVRVHTPGTALEEAYLESGANNFVAALALSKEQWALACCDNSTGEFFCLALPPGDLAALDAELERLRPAECLAPEGGLPEDVERLLGQRRLLLSLQGPWSFEPAEAGRLLREHFGVATLEGFGLPASGAPVAACGALLAYLKRTQRSPLSHLTGLRCEAPGAFLRLDAAAQRHLELTANQADGGRKDTLFWVLDHTRSAAGSRLLKRWLSAPLVSLGAIDARLEAVQALKDDPALLERLGEALALTTDVERLVAKVGCLAAGPRDLASLRTSLRQWPVLTVLLEGQGASLLAPWKDAGSLQGLRQRLDAALVEDPPLRQSEGGYIRPGFDAELDQVLTDCAGAKEEVLAVQERERGRSGNPKLKVQFNSVFGYYIEVSKAQAAGVPGDWDRKQTLVNAERYTTPQLKAIEARVLGAEERRKAMEQALFERLRAEVAELSGPLLAAAAWLAGVDALASLARAAARHGYVRPQVDASEVLDIEQGRHPVVEAILRREGGEAFVPNDCRLDTEAQQLMLITGPNMAGKSTYMRQCALIALMAQVGSFVPAARARVGLVDRIFTRVGASDRLSQGMSTFLVEMTECAAILRHATRRSLVVLDEIGRGTSTYDGVSIAMAVAEHLHDAPQLGCRTLFATHYFELAELEGRLARAKNYCVAVREWQGRIVFLHAIRPGSSEHSYGVAVARLAGVPEPVLRRAKALLDALELQHRPAAAPGAAPQLDLFAAGSGAESAVLRLLEGMDPDGMTPLQALQALAQLKAAAPTRSAGGAHA